MEIYEAVLKEGIEAHKALGIKSDEKALKRSVADGLIGEALLLREARSRKIDVKDEDVKKTIDAMRGNKKEEEFRREVEEAGLSYDTFQILKPESVFVKIIQLTNEADESQQWRK